MNLPEPPNLSETILVQIKSVAVINEPDGSVERLQVRVLPVGKRVPEMPAYTIHAPTDASLLFEVPETLGVNLRPGRYLAVALRTCTPAEIEQAERIETEIRTAHHRELETQRVQQQTMFDMAKGIAQSYGVSPPRPLHTVVPGDGLGLVTPVRPVRPTLTDGDD